LDGPLGLTEAAWLDEHLADCGACAEVAAAYEADRLTLRNLRLHTPDPPRDLWPRTAAAIEREATARPAGRPRGAERSGGRLPLAAVSSLAVIVIVVGLAAWSGGGFLIGRPLGPSAGDDGGAGPSVAAAATASGGTVAAEATPIAVDPGDVAWIDQGPSGKFGYSAVAIDAVCPAEDVSGCPALGEGRRSDLALAAAPRTLIGSPSRKQAIAIADNGDAGDQLLIVDLPEPEATAAPTAPPTRSAPPSETPAPTEPPAATPSTDPQGTGDPPTETPRPTDTPAPTPTVEPSVPASGSPVPTVAAALAIASDIEVIGESAAFSADGGWFAFTARPSDGSSGPNVYVWRVGDERAHPLTSDGASYFGSWAGDRVVASRPERTGERTADATTVGIDPATGAETDLGDLWRPVVDPTGTLAIGWDGSIRSADADTAWTPAHGTLELRTWSDDGAGRDRGRGEDRVVTDEAAADFDVRWDETGEWVAVWVADPRDASIGRLTLYRVDEERLERVDGAPVEVPALPGFSIGDGRLAWATPRGQGGEGSRIQIAAWSKGDVGTVESRPGEGLIVVR
jgi:hypothetical protein